MPMRRADRRDDSYDNSIHHPQSRQAEQLSYHELKNHWLVVRNERDELKQYVQENEQKAELFHHLYITEQSQHQTTLTLYHDAQNQVQSYLTLYNQEQTRCHELAMQYEAAQAERQHYLTLYQQAQGDLKFERRSKAGIKSWETRRKRENERLKQEIAAMTVMLRDSMNREEGAIENLEAIAQRMDKIQSLIDSVDEETTHNPVGLLHKFQRIWQAVKEILAE